jgi:hypothetical protein
MKNEIEEIKEEKVERFGDQFNFMQLYRVKGLPGLYTTISKANRAGMVGVMEFMNFKNVKSRPTHQLVCLGALHFYREPGNEPLSMNDVFSNIHEFHTSDEKAFKKMRSIGDKKLLDIMVPNYDIDAFKFYHAEQVLTWYDIIISALDKLKEEEKNETIDQRKD